MKLKSRLIKDLSVLWSSKEASATSLPIQIRGWVQTARKQKRRAFLDISDGSYPKGIQVVVENPQNNLPENIPVGSSVEISGSLVENPRGGLEILVDSIPILSSSDSEGKHYPLSQPNLEYPYLRTIPHLRCRHSSFISITHIRNTMTMSVHEYLQGLGLVQIHAPVLTSSDCEGAGEQFMVKASDDDFFGKENDSYLTVSSQLHAEAFATAILPGVYSFGPTFRAEKSHTSRHLAEFWMLEPEIGHANLSDVMDITEGLVRKLAKNVLDKNNHDISFLSEFHQISSPSRLESLLSPSPFPRITYSEAIRILQASNRSFEQIPKWETGLSTEHERYLSEEYLKGPVFVTDYPTVIKPFYMKSSSDKTVAAMDLLLPFVGEVAGGSERIDTYNELVQRLGPMSASYDWYLDLRRFGTIPHAGFGLGFDRLVQYICGLSNIRDALPFPRSPGEILL